MKKFFGLLLIGFFLAGLSSAQTTQKPNPGPSSSQSPGQNAAAQIQVHVNLENVLFTVLDKKNRLVTNLKKEDFKVY
jgi:hypothetical protein